MNVAVDEINILQAAMVHSISWQDSHQSFRSPDFIKLHTPEHQQEYMKVKMYSGSKCYMLVEDEPIGIVSVTDSLIEDLYIFPNRKPSMAGNTARCGRIFVCTPLPPRQKGQPIFGQNIYL